MYCNIGEIDIELSSIAKRQEGEQAGGTGLGAIPANHAEEAGVWPTLPPAMAHTGGGIEETGGRRITGVFGG